MSGQIEHTFPAGLENFSPVLRHPGYGGRGAAAIVAALGGTGEYLHAPAVHTTRTALRRLRDRQCNPRASLLLVHDDIMCGTGVRWDTEGNG